MIKTKTIIINNHFKAFSFITLLAISTILASCFSNDVDRSKIEYATINELDYKKELEITDSENFVASNLNGFFATEDGDLLITERSGPGIHQFTSEGEYVKRIARDGRGPGELSPWFHSHFNGKTLIATNNPGHNSTIFQQNENGLFHYVKTLSHEYPGSFRGLRTEDDFNSFYSIENKAMQDLKVPPEFSYSNIHIIEVKGDSITIRDSVKTIRTHSDFVETFNGGGISITTLPYRYSDSFQPLPDRHMMIVKPDSQVIRIYDQNIEKEHELKLNVSERLVSSQNLEYHIGEHDASIQSKMRELIKEVKPAFMNVRMDDSNRFWLWTDETERGREYVVLNYEGDPLGKVLLPSGQKIEMISENKLYVLSEPEDDIPSAIVYSLDL